MKASILFIAGSMVFGLSACNNAESRYMNLSTGEGVELEKDEKTGLMVDAETGEPVEIYVDTRSKDTIWGSAGEVINGYVYRTDNGEWEFKEEDFKVKADGDEYKMKSGDDYKVKRDDGEYKIKNGDYKKEVEKDGDITIKNGDTKIKIDGETGERKVKND